LIVAWTQVDDGDIPIATRFSWRLHPAGYAIANDAANRTLLLHREILGLGPRARDAREVDHVNRDKLDNRRANLRMATRALNNQNTPARKGSSSPHRGVAFDPRPKSAAAPYRARVQLNRVNYELGSFATEAEAARAASAFRARHMPFSEDALSLTTAAGRSVLDRQSTAGGRRSPA
jgi:hypothetical protein